MSLRRHAVVVLIAALVGTSALVAVPAAAPVSAASTEALLIGDSVMNGMAQTYGAPARALLAARHSFILDAAGCRRLITTSCRILPSPAPTNAITVLRARAGQFRRVLVIGAGYNDTTTGTAGVGAAVDVMMAEAKRQGVPYVVWLTYREAGPSAPRFRAHNALLRAKTGQYSNLRLADWATRSASMPTSWFSADGIHLGSQAASGMADLIADTIDVLPPLTPPPPPPPTRCDAPLWVGSAPTAGAAATADVTGGVHLLSTPVRVLNTRAMTGTLGAGRMLSIPIAGANGVAADATAALVNVTAVRPCLGTAITAYPCGGGVPLASMLNAPAGAVVANSAVVPLGAGALCVYSSNPSDVLVDVTGWVGSGGDLTTVVDPARLVDTRAGQPQAAATPQVRLAADQHLTVDLRGTVPAIDATATGVTAVSLAVTALAPSAPPPGVTGYVTLLPGACTADVPTTSTLNTATGHDIAASTTIGLVDGQFCIYTSTATDLAVDLQAVHGATGTSMQVITPLRLGDTRPTVVQPGVPLQIDLAAPPSGVVTTVPDGLTGVVLDVVAVAPGAPASLSVYPCSGTALPPQVIAGVTTADRVLVASGIGTVCVSTTAPVNIVVDLEAWLA